MILNTVFIYSLLRSGNVSDKVPVDDVLCPFLKMICGDSYFQIHRRYRIHIISNILSHSVPCLWNFLHGVFNEHKFRILMKLFISIFFFLQLILFVLYVELLPIPES